MNELTFPHVVGIIIVVWGIDELTWLFGGKSCSLGDSALLTDLVMVGLCQLPFGDSCSWGDSALLTDLVMAGLSQLPFGQTT